VQVISLYWSDEVTAGRCGCCTSLLHFSVCRARQIIGVVTVHPCYQVTAATIALAVMSRALKPVALSSVHCHPVVTDTCISLWLRLPA
jgi:hypothetical protein